MTEELTSKIRQAFGTQTIIKTPQPLEVYLTDVHYLHLLKISYSRNILIQME